MEMNSIRSMEAHPDLPDSVHIEVSTIEIQTQEPEDPLPLDAGLHALLLQAAEQLHIDEPDTLLQYHCKILGCFDQENIVEQAYQAIHANTRFLACYFNGFCCILGFLLSMFRLVTGTSSTEWNTQKVVLCSGLVVCGILNIVVIFYIKQSSIFEQRHTLKSIAVFMGAFLTCGFCWDVYDLLHTDAFHSWNGASALEVGFIVGFFLYNIPLLVMMLMLRLPLWQCLCSAVMLQLCTMLSEHVTTAMIVMMAVFLVVLCVCMYSIEISARRNFLSNLSVIRFQAQAKATSEARAKTEIELAATQAENARLRTATLEDLWSFFQDKVLEGDNTTSAALRDVLTRTWWNEISQQHIQKLRST